MIKHITVEEMKADPVFSLPIDALKLGARARNGLYNDSVRYVGDLVQKSEQEVMRIPAFGRLSYNEVQEALAERNLKFEMISLTSDQSVELATHFQKHESAASSCERAAKLIWDRTKGSPENAAPSGERSTKPVDQGKQTPPSNQSPRTLSRSSHLDVLTPRELLIARRQTRALRGLGR